jgi:hypothetical protein
MRCRQCGRVLMHGDGIELDGCEARHITGICGSEGLIQSWHLIVPLRIGDSGREVDCPTSCPHHDQKIVT